MGTGMIPNRDKTYQIMPMDSLERTFSGMNINDNNNDSEVPAINLKDIKVEVMEAYIKNEDEWTEERVLYHKHFWCFAKVQYPELKEGQKLEVGIVQVLYHAQNTWKVGDNTMTWEIPDLAIGKVHQMLDNTVPCLHPYSDGHDDYDVISGPAQAGTVELVSDDLPENPDNWPNTEWMTNYQKFHVYLIVRDLTRKPRMLVLRTMQWETLSHWKYDAEADDLIYAGPFVPYQQPICIKNDAKDLTKDKLTLTEDIIRGKTVNTSDLCFEIKQRKGRAIYIMKPEEYLQLPITSYLSQLNFDNDTNVLPLYLNTINPLFTCSYAAPKIPPREVTDRCFRCISPAFVNTAVVRIPRLLKGQRLRLRWLLACCCSTCYNEYNTGQASWEFHELGDSNPLIRVALPTDEGFTIEGPTFTHKDITLITSFRIHIKASIRISEKSKDRLIHTGVYMKFHSYVLAEDLVHNTLHPLVKLGHRLSVTKSKRHTFIPKPRPLNRELNNIDKLIKGISLDKSQFLVWRTEEDPNKVLIPPLIAEDKYCVASIESMESIESYLTETEEELEEVEDSDKVVFAAALKARDAARAKKGTEDRKRKASGTICHDTTSRPKKDERSPDKLRSKSEMSET